MGNKKIRNPVRLFLLSILAACLVILGFYKWRSAEHAKQQEGLSRLRIQEVSAEQTEPETAETAGEEEETAENKEPSQASVMLDKFKDLYACNSDIVGWLSIDGMNIDYPVMQCEDNEYYLHRNFYGEEDKYGTLYVKDIADVNTPGTNFVIYGHNMKDGSMFGNLDDYRQESFYREHSVISFDTLFEERSYEIVSVFLSQVYQAEDKVFKYYRFYEAHTPEEFYDFYENIKELAIYDTGVTAEYGDTFLTLSTCAYHVEDGRLVVVAKRIRDFGYNE